MANTHSLDLERGSNQYASIADAAQTGLDLSGDFTIVARVFYPIAGVGGTKQYQDSEFFEFQDAEFYDFQNI